MMFGCFIRATGTPPQPALGEISFMNEPVRNRKLGAAGWVALIVLAGLLAVSVWYAIHVWGALSGVAMSPLG